MKKNTQASRYFELESALANTQVSHGDIHSWLNNTNTHKHAAPPSAEKVENKKALKTAGRRVIECQQQTPPRHQFTRVVGAADLHSQDISHLPGRDLDTMISL